MDESEKEPTRDVDSDGTGRKNDTEKKSWLKIYVFVYPEAVCHWRCRTRIALEISETLRAGRVKHKKTPDKLKASVRRFQTR